MFACGASPAGRRPPCVQLRHPPIADHRGGHPSTPAAAVGGSLSPWPAPVESRRSKGGRPSSPRHETGVNEIELQRLYEPQLTPRRADRSIIPIHDRDAAATVLVTFGRLLGARLPPGNARRSDRDTVLRLDDVTMDRPTDGLIARLHRADDHGLQTSARFRWQAPLAVLPSLPQKRTPATVPAGGSASAADYLPRTPLRNRAVRNQPNGCVNHEGRHVARRPHRRR